MSSTRRRRILYIAGYSRSGSTILDMVLNTHPDAASAGELTFLHGDAEDPSLLCGCGRTYRDCEIYGDWLRNRPPGEAAAVRRTEQRRALGHLERMDLPGSDQSLYRDYAQSLFDHLHDRHGAAVLVDSSKSAGAAAGRPLALLRAAGLDVHVLHLTRDPRAVLDSYIHRGSNWVLEGRREARPLDTWRPVFGWTLANRVAYQVGRQMGPERYMHLRFEDFLADPAHALQRIGTFIGLDTGAVARAVLDGKPFAAGHNVGGNRTRRASRKINLDTPPPVRLPARYALGLRAFGGRTIRRFGYV